jgi:hypothetical protein
MFLAKSAAKEKESEVGETAQITFEWSGKALKRLSVVGLLSGV